MDFKNKPYLFLPLLSFALIFSLDKLLLCPAVQERTVLWKKIEPPFYASREDLAAQLATETESAGLILGSSRAGEFSSDWIARHSPVKRTYNFSAPLTCPAYHYYWLDRILKGGHRPAFVILEADLLLFSEGAMDYALNYSFDPLFVLRHTDVLERQGAGFALQGRGFTFDEAETFFLKYFFALYRFPLDAKALRENGQEIFLPDGTYRSGRELRGELNRLIERVNREKLGGIPNPLQFNVPEDAMAEDARRLADRHLSRPPSPTQILFFKRIVEALRQEKIPLVVYWPLVSEPLDRLQRQARPDFQNELKQYLTSLQTNDWQPAFLDPNPDPRIRCRSFVDSSHLSGKCFDEITLQLLAALRLAESP
ncbi:MAG: DUF1574 family protein [Spirochaetales bacterium]|nr:DUF1574 family protein [Spirochaetales bacterium]